MHLGFPAQTYVTLSTTKAEFVALADVLREVKCFRGRFGVSCRLM